MIYNLLLHVLGIQPRRRERWFCLACNSFGHVWSACPNPGTFCKRHGRRHRDLRVCPPGRKKG